MRAAFSAAIDSIGDRLRCSLSSGLSLLILICGLRLHDSNAQTSRRRDVRKIIALSAFIIAATVAPSNAESARVEDRSFNSVTLTDSDLLAGRDGKPVSITGKLRVPEAANGKLPAVILLHGSGGIGGVGSTIDGWSKELNQLGIATFAIDSFAGRGITSTVMDQTQLSRLNMVVDAYRGLNLLAQDPRVDPNRIAVMGFSRGAQSALYSAMDRFSGLANNNVRFAVHVVFYADCTTSRRYRRDRSDPRFPRRSRQLERRRTLPRLLRAPDGGRQGCQID
jgi:acetyl esterase/lipase